MNTTLSSMSVIDAIHKRRSVRSFKPDKVQNGSIRTLLAAAVQAPTAMHEEPWVFTIVQDAAMLKRLSDAAKTLCLAEAERVPTSHAEHLIAMLRQPEFNVFYNAGTLIVIGARPRGHFAAADCWLAAENLMLAACSMDLGTCVIGLAVSSLNTAEMKTEIGIPADVSVIAPIIVGVPSGEIAPVSRKAPDILAWK